ncbi:hypothetical protein [Chitinophaga caseinilytica]|uniref:Uncharacterized protein n=1 Tax=Chitinophaga caseinilytica TaxID=2267521 RepID=A0ABZ2YYC9_9BACT
MERSFRRQHTYLKSLIWSLISTIIPGFLCIALFLISDEVFVLMVGLPFILLIQIPFKFRRHRYFINYIQIENGLVYIDYTDRNEHRTISGPFADFKMRHRIAGFFKPPQHSLRIYFKGKIVARQYENGTWTIADIQFFDAMYPVYIPSPEEFFGNIWNKIRRKQTAD